MIGKRAAAIGLAAVGVAAIVSVCTVRQHVAPTVSAASPAPAPALPSAGGTRSSAPAPIASAARSVAAAPSHSPAPPSRAAVAAAEPFVQTFADQPGVRPLPAVPSPTATLRIPVNIDGCDHNYGAPAQCVPWTFPAGATDKCGWLAAHDFKKLKVVGADRQHLDPDRDGIAC